jgi:hypothetical protein
MLKLALKLALVAAALWAVWTWVPIGDRTLAQRFRAAGSLERFASRGWAELRAATGDEPAVEKKPAPAAGSRAPARAGRTGREPRASEGPTEADRRALDRIIAERLRD